MPDNDVVATDQQLLRTADLGKMYDEAYAKWQAGNESLDWESLDQTNWEK